ncbi:MAG TPA: Crp/Fnr family transcriptional regulator, partial [Bacteroidia bacterium]
FLPVEEFEIVRFPQRQHIYFNGDTPEGIYIVISGKIKIYLNGNGSREQIIRIAVPNDVIGYENLLNESIFFTSAVAHDDVQLRFIPKDMFMYLVKNNPEFMNAFLLVLCNDLIEKEKQTIDFAYMPVRGRLAYALLLLDNIFKNGADENISLSRSELAGYIGSVRETTTRLLSEFKHENLIEINGAEIKLLNRNKLEEISKMYE